MDDVKGISGTPQDLLDRSVAFGENRVPDPPFESECEFARGCATPVLARAVSEGAV